MNRAVLILTAHEAAVFSKRAATEGEHQTLAHPTGAALLGWAARRYDTFGEDDRYTIFHSGDVRFSNALPLTEDGAIAYPAPQLITQPKHAKGGVVDGALVRDQLRVGRKPPKPTQDDEAQYEAIGKALFITADARVVAAQLGSRLRTATSGGRAAAGQLFGYEHISPDQVPRYAATIEAEGLSDAAWNRLLDIFRGDGDIHLGRASNTSYGGAYNCNLHLPDDNVQVWPRGGVATGASHVRVWALSDLALVDDEGSPSFQPTAAMLGLPGEGRLDGADSAIGVRRYAPWNGKLRSRDLERQVIEAGSVITFSYDTPLPQCDGLGVVGVWRETGLGRIWVAPPLLEGEPGDPPGPNEKPFSVGPARKSAPNGAPATADDLALMEWLGGRS